MKKVILLPAFILLAFITNGQVTGSISGTVGAKDKLIEAATVSLLRSADSSLVKIAVTDKSGAYLFEKIPYGKYLLKTESVGYQAAISPVIELNASANTLTVPAMELQVEAKTLATVNVTGKRAYIENRIDKTVVNVDASPTNTGLTAMEVLEKSPGVSIDNNGNITLKGKQGVVILIDDKPTYLSGNDLTNYLKNLTSNQLDQIEIMTQPSAKYDASGNSGIINIKLKKNRSQGLNGTISTSAIFANYFKNTNSINFNRRSGKINIFGNAGYSYWDGFEELFLNRSSREDRTMPFERYVKQHTYGRYTGRPYYGKIGVDWFANKKTTFGIVISQNVDNDKFTSTSHADILNSSGIRVQYNDALSETHNPWKNTGFNLNFTSKLDTSGAELSGSADFINYGTRGKQYSYNYLYEDDGTPSEDPYLLEGYLPADINILSIKLDFKKLFKSNTTFEAGLKSSYVETDNDAQYTRFDEASQSWAVDNTRSNHFIYRENINAGYVNVQKQIQKWNLQLGLRAEQTVADGNQVTKFLSFHKNYVRLFPTTYFGYKFNDKHTVAASYGRRIQRPGYQSLNPFQFQLDRYTYQQGNPNLQPQFSNNIELSYNYKGQINVTANYTTITDIINDVLISVKEPGDSNYTTFLTTENIAASKNLGLAVNFNKQLAKWWTINIFANVYNNAYKGVIDEENIDLNYTGVGVNMSSQFNFNKGWTGEVSGFYNSKQLVSSAILADPMYMFSVGGGKQVLKERGSIRVNIRDPFYMMKFKAHTDLDKGITDILSRWDNRRFIITLTYRFGKSGQEVNRNRSSAADDEKGRMNTGGRQ